MAQISEKLESLVLENESIKRELAELKKLCTQREMLHQSELLALKKDIERLKKTQPDVSTSSPQGSPDIYTRVKAMKRRPQSMHEMAIVPPNVLEEVQKTENTQAHTILGQIFPGSVPPFYFTLPNYTHCKKNALKWFSPSFYTHPYGYKLCICVDAGGSSVGEGTHVSVLVYILQGEYDEFLRWPFRGTVTIQLLNELRDFNHFESSVVFDGDTPLVNSGQVLVSDRSTGWGNHLFIEFSKLGYDNAMDCEFLKYDRLRFAVKEVNLMP